MTAYNFLIRRMLTLPLNVEQQRIEWKQILHIAHSNSIPINMLSQLKLRIQRNNSQTKPSIPTPYNKHTKWATFTFSSPQIRKITNIFKHTDVKIAFKCDNTISQLSKPASRSPPTTPYVRPGIYSLSCLTCKKEYVGQTSRSLELRYKEHIIIIIIGIQPLGRSG